MQLACADPRLTQPYALDVLRDLLTLPMTLISNTVALVVSLAANGQKLASPRRWSALGLVLARGLAGSLYYDRNTVILLQHIDHGFKELGLLAHELQLLLPP